MKERKQRQRLALPEESFLPSKSCGKVVVRCPSAEVCEQGRGAHAADVGVEWRSWRGTGVDDFLGP